MEQERQNDEVITMERKRKNDEAITMEHERKESITEIRSREGESLEDDRMHDHSGEKVE